MKEIVYRIPWTLQHVPKGFRMDVGHIWDVVVRKRGTELMSTNQMVNGTKLLKSWCWTSLKVDGHPAFRATSASERGEFKKQRWWKEDIVHCNGSEHPVELILRAIISVNQLSIYGTVADLCEEEDPDSRNQTEGEICESLVIPTEITNANAKSQSSTSSTQGGFLQEYERKLAELLDDQKLSKLCTDAHFLKEIGKGQFFFAIEKGSENMQTACREYTRSRNLKTSRPRGWIRSNTKISPVLDLKIFLHEGRYCNDTMIESLFQNQRVSWDRIVNGINKYVTETSREIPIENVQLFMSTGRLVAKAKSRPKLVVNLFSNNVPINERIWTDIHLKPFNQGCFAVSKFMMHQFLEKTLER